MDIARRLEHRYQVRFDEADASGHLRPAGFLRYAQDMAWRHSEEAGFGRHWYAERGLHWLVRHVDLRIDHAVAYGDIVATTTEVIAWRQVLSRRHAEMRVVGSAERSDGDGAAAHPGVAARVDTDWVLLTLEGRPARVPDEILAMFGSRATFERSRALPCEPPAEAWRFSTRVRPADVDPMAHVNNAAYLDVVEEALAALAQGASGPRTLRLPPGAPVGCRYRLGYVRPALPSARLEVAVWQRGRRQRRCRIADGDGQELTRVLISSRVPHGSLSVVGAPTKRSKAATSASPNASGSSLRPKVIASPISRVASSWRSSTGSTMMASRRRWTGTRALLRASWTTPSDESLRLTTERSFPTVPRATAG